MHKCIHCLGTFKTGRALEYHIVIKHPEVTTSVTRKIHQCPYCSFRTFRKEKLQTHLLKHPDAVANIKLIECEYCNDVFRRNTSLGDHMIQNHPEHMSGVTCKIYECPVPTCNYRTTTKYNLVKHMPTHPNITNYKVNTCPVPTCNYKTTTKRYMVSHMKTHQDDKSSSCVHCNAIFKQRKSLDDHILKKHPKFVESVKRVIYECPYCPNKTVYKWKHDDHLLVHPEAAHKLVLLKCMHCESTFKIKRELDDHIVRKHPEFMASVTRKIHQCPYCPYRTVKSTLDKHLMKHRDDVSSTKLRTCRHCNKSFKQKESLDNHMLKEHPEFTESVTRNVHQCPYCPYRNVRKVALDRHITTHPEADSSITLITCEHCNKSFKRKQSLHDHIIRKHPDFISSVTAKIHECAHCPYKTMRRNDLKLHETTHHDASTSQ
ncbi:unnamed protein product [Acanthoscelides obtectus]|uniref:C2H2-type domain-containing protein n=1 Tax=Acanthoscelides obtectus TaxID=200917 RepID=A0A9P0KRH8_ACAOB|nr:unnamed protein product [Acanthoscelides obtectus]CAK1675758.1 Zinc finger Y-chromosomal protein [Acanthoscelides obtectus]